MTTPKITILNARFPEVATPRITTSIKPWRGARIRPHALFTVWSPDEVAECLEGVPSALYSKIWNEMVPLYDKESRSEWNDDYDRRCLAQGRFWKLLSAEDRTLLNELAAKHAAKYRDYHPRASDRD